MCPPKSKTTKDSTLILRYDLAFLIKI
uniref:Uncharacterized protein n=1 Tax=Arundo donax TaxID=35708 RepID=A0A0A9FI10_ARUDO